MWVGTFLFNTSISIGLIAWAVSASRKVMPTSRKEGFNRWWIDWSIKGLVVPMVIWSLMNVGISFTLQPFMPQLQAVRNAGSNWGPLYMRILVTGVFIISSYWSAATLGWALFV